MNPPAWFENGSWDAPGESRRSEDVREEQWGRQEMTKTGLEVEVVVVEEGGKVKPTYQFLSPAQTHSLLQGCGQETPPFPQTPVVFPLFFDGFIIKW